MSGPIKAVLEVLALLKDIEWARCVGDETASSLSPPLVAWRYKTPDAKAEVKIVEAVGNYSGAMGWSVEKGDRNWVISPAEFKEFASGFRLDVDAFRAFGAQYPSRTRLALADAVPLAAHLRRILLPQ